MILIKRESPSHWYLQDGTPFHEVERADGRGLRAVTLRDARKVNAYPSVTNVLGVLSKPGLEAWKQEQAIMAALTLPRNDGEPLDDFARRVVQDMGEQVEKAADLGSQIHAAIEVYLQTGEAPEAPDILRLFEPVRGWIDDHVLRIERVEGVVTHHGFGYAGRVDLVAKLRFSGEWTVLDFKTQRFKKDTKGNLRPTFYETWPLQLEAYRRAIIHSAEGKQPQDIASLVISSQEPAPVHLKVWPREEHDSYWSAFQSARELWCWMKGYRPASPQPAPLAAAA